MQLIFHPEQRVTEWFISEQPAYSGVYERDIDDLSAKQPMYGWWNGWMWFQSAHSPERAKELADKGYESVYQLTDERQAWRGLLRNPEDGHLPEPE